MTNEILGLILIGCMLFAIFVGFPISFTLIFLGLVFGYIGFGEAGVLPDDLSVFRGHAGTDPGCSSALYLHGHSHGKSGPDGKRFFRAVQLMLSRTHGALFIAVLFVSTIFAAATGIVGASVTILGIMAAKTMNRSGYDVRLAAGTITAGGTLGILIPPSIMLVVMGPILEVPVTDLFAAAIVPGATPSHACIPVMRFAAVPTRSQRSDLRCRRISNPTRCGRSSENLCLGLVPPAGLWCSAALGSILIWASDTYRRGGHGRLSAPWC